jgi:ElaA protein
VITVHDARVKDLDSATLYRILALRVDVFVAEQCCAYPDLDGRDLEDSARQLWAAEGDEVCATLRLLREADGTSRIGRVATALPARGRGLAAALLRRALEIATAGDVVLDSQAHLVGFYARFGFVTDGPHFTEDSIEHVPMRHRR